jgi:hypothetical protein
MEIARLSGTHAVIYSDSTHPRRTSKPLFNLGEDSFCIELEWNISNEDSRYRSSVLAVEANSDGGIRVHGGIFRGTSGIIPETIWRNNPEALEAALENAYSHPGTYIFRGSSVYKSRSYREEFHGPRASYEDSKGQGR